MFDLLLIMINNIILMGNMTYNEELAVRNNEMFWSAIIWGIIICLVFVLGFVYLQKKVLRYD